jgi:hypothetical protein
VRPLDQLNALSLFQRRNTTWKTKRNHHECNQLSDPSAEQCVAVECPAFGDLDFWQTWVSLARLVDLILCGNLERASVEVREYLFNNPINFFTVARLCEAKGIQGFSSFSIGTSDMLVEAFPLFVELGFFQLTGDRYQITLPHFLNLERVERAILSLVDNIDANGTSNPESGLNLISEIAYERLSCRLREMEENVRVEERQRLLHA